MKNALPLLLLTSIAFAAETPVTKPEAPKAPANKVGAVKTPPKKVYPKNPAPT